MVKLAYLKEERKPFFSQFRNYPKSKAGNNENRKNYSQQQKSDQENQN